MIVHPGWAGVLGLWARGLVAHVLENATTIYTEATAMMGSCESIFLRRVVCVRMRGIVMCMMRRFCAGA